MAIWFLLLQVFLHFARLEGWVLSKEKANSIKGGWWFSC
jgi:hypothetical protein